MIKKTHKRHTKTKKNNLALHITIVVFAAFLLFVGVTAKIAATPNANPLCANSISCAKDLSGKPSTDSQGVFLGQTVKVPGIPTTETFAIDSARQAVLGDTTATKHIYVDLTSQKIYAYEGNSLFMDEPISSGLYNPTPTGDFHIWVWLKATRMTGGKGADAYDLPNVPYTMYFYNDQVQKAWGYSLHGTYWHHNFGHPMSHGCVNMITADAEKLYYWSNPNITGFATYATPDFQGPTITIYGTTPKS